jgi:hypothetical protein
MSYVDEFRNNVNKLMAERDAFDKVKKEEEKKAKAAKA